MKNKQVYRSGIISILGRPSTGKSSLINLFCGQMVAIVSPLPQTTHNRIRGIVSREEGQAVFCDTPGYHNSRRRINTYLRAAMMRSLAGIDSLLYMIDASRKGGLEEQELISLVSTVNCPVFVAINKTDLLPEAERSIRLDKIQQFVTDNLQPTAMLPISVQEKVNTDALLAMLMESLPPGKPLYPEDVYTDQEPVFRISEVVRGQAWRYMREELPYSMFVHVHDVRIKKRRGQADAPISALFAHCTIFVEQESQKGMVVGKGGKIIGLIREGAEAVLADIFPYPVRLRLRVQVAPKWRKDRSILRRQIN